MLLTPRHVFPWQRYSKDGYDSNQRWALPVLHFPINMVIYHYPPVAVIFMVILHVSIIKSHPNLFSSYYSKHTIWVIYSFSINLGEFVYNVVHK